MGPARDVGENSGHPGHPGQKTPQKMAETNHLAKMAKMATIFPISLPTQKGERRTMKSTPTIDEILSAFEELTQSDDDPRGNPIKMQILQVMDAAPDGLIVSEVVAALLGRELSATEDDYIFLRIEDSEGHA